MATRIYKDIIAITEEYLGPAAERFIDRLSTYHLHKKSDELTAKDVQKLTGWIKASMGLLTEDKLLVDNYVERVMKLAG